MKNKMVPIVTDVTDWEFQALMNNKGWLPLDSRLTDRRLTVGGRATAIKSSVVSGVLWYAPCWQQGRPQ